MKLPYSKPKKNTLDLERLQEEIDIVSLARQMGMQVRGTQGRCYNSQFHKHGDRAFSLTFGSKDKKNLYYCFACGERGNVVSLYQHIRGLATWMDAARELWHDYFGGISNGLGKDKSLVYRNPAPVVEKKIDLKEFSDIYTDVVKFCGPPQGAYLKYLTGSTRKLTKETIAKFRICAVNDWKWVEQELKNKYPLERLKASGVFWPQSGQFVYRGQWVLVPFFEDGQVVFLQGRRLGDGKPKYLHLRGLPVPLFNRDTLLDASAGSEVYVCEGVFDAIVMEQWGRKAVGILGVNNFKPYHAQLLQPYRVTIATDNDQAGITGASKISDMLWGTVQETEKGKVTVFRLPEGIKDMTEFYIHELDKLQVKT